MGYEQIIYGLIVLFVLSPVAGWVAFIRKKDKEALDNAIKINAKQETKIAMLEKDMQHLKESMITEEKVRSIVHENIEPIKEGQSEIKNTVTSIHESITEMRIQWASQNGHANVGQS